MKKQNNEDVEEDFEFEEEKDNANYESDLKEGEDYSYEFKIPKSRIAVLIGKKGETKTILADEIGIDIDVDSNEGDVTISGKDSIKLFVARDVILAIGRGFNPDIAKLLLKQDYAFEIIGLADYAGKSKNNMVRFKGRIIGSEGKARRTIEELTECHISVFGKTIGIIGELGNVANAKKAIIDLLSGAPHSSVYRFLEKQKRMSRMPI